MARARLAPVARERRLRGRHRPPGPTVHAIAEDDEVVGARLQEGRRAHAALRPGDRSVHAGEGRRMEPEACTRALSRLGVLQALVVEAGMAEMRTFIHAPRKGADMRIRAINMDKHA